MKKYKVINSQSGNNISEEIIEARNLEEAQEFVLEVEGLRIEEIKEE